MLKIAAVLMTTSAFAGLIIAGPASQASNGSPFATQVPTVKVKTISIRMMRSPLAVTPASFSAGALDGTQLLAGPASEGETPA